MFAPTVNKYLESNNLPQKAIFVFNNAPSYLIDIEKDLDPTMNFIETKFLLGTTNTRVTKNFRKTYTKLLFQTCFDAVINKKMDLRDFWKNHFDILACLKILDKTIDEVSLKMTDFSWGTLWPVSLNDCEQPKLSLEEEIIQLGAAMGLEVDRSDIYELIQEIEEAEPIMEKSNALDHPEVVPKGMILYPV